MGQSLLWTRAGGGKSEEGGRGTEAKVNPQPIWSRKKAGIEAGSDHMEASGLFDPVYEAGP